MSYNMNSGDQDKYGEMDRKSMWRFRIAGMLAVALAIAGGLLSRMH
jgi:hypothetical protein